MKSDSSNDRPWNKEAVASATVWNDRRRAARPGCAGAAMLF